MYEGDEIVLSIGHMKLCNKQFKNLMKKISLSLYMRFVKPLDEKLLHKILKSAKFILTVEDVCVGGFGSAVLEFIVMVTII